jgi:hypothetical protein
MTDLSWKLAIRGLKSKIDPDRRRLIERVIREQAGEEVPLRIARKSLLMLAVEALLGKPRLVSVHGDGVLVVIALRDLLEVLAEPGPTLAEVMRGALIGPVKPADRSAASE